MEEQLIKLRVNLVIARNKNVVLEKELEKAENFINKKCGDAGKCIMCDEWYDYTQYCSGCKVQDSVIICKKCATLIQCAYCRRYSCKSHANACSRCLLKSCYNCTLTCPDCNITLCSDYYQAKYCKPSTCNCRISKLLDGIYIKDVLSVIMSYV